MKRHLHNHVLIAILSFVLWGFFPLYFKLLTKVNPFEVMVHRIIWSFILMVIIVVCIKRSKEALQIYKNKMVLLKLTFSGILISTNWLVYIYAVSNNKVLEASLGYYTSPLLTIFMGLLFLKEKVGTIKKVAIALTMIALIVKVSSVNSLSFISLGVAFTFSLYSLIKKTIKINSLLLFAVELSIIFIPALAYWVTLIVQGNSVFTFSFGSGTGTLSGAVASSLSRSGAALGMGAISGAWHINLLLIGLGIVTASPLLLFNRSVQKVDLNIMGFIQYITPTMIFLLAIYLYNEKFSSQDIIVFTIIWIAIILVRIENYRNRKLKK